MSDLAPTRPGRLWSGTDGKFNLEAALFAIGEMGGHYGTAQQPRVEQQLRYVHAGAKAEPDYWTDAITALQSANHRMTNTAGRDALASVIATAEHGLKRGAAPSSVAALTA
ncbi:MAG: hypothetical protein KBA75_06790 [Alphaproteobacteria bacterium]|nr:hypothetical protein [Alphaproteobacteria bacterium]